jgi:hypothetical protein
MGAYEILQRVVHHNLRPPLDNIELPAMAELIKDCWNAEPHWRPSFDEILPILKRMRSSSGSNKDLTQI